MRLSVILVITWALCGCQSNADQVVVLQQRVDSLENQLAQTYRPGLGDFMSSVQIHHNKLWFAGLEQNWELADFEVHEIMEAIEDIRKYQADRPESQKIGVILPDLDSVRTAIIRKNPTQFKKNYTDLTRACNNCHQATNFQFNIVTIPDRSPFSNQDFANHHAQ